MVITLFVMLLVALAYVARGARKLDVSLDSLLHAQRAQRREMEENVERLRQYYNRT